MSGYLYILKSSKTGKYYVGSTNDLQRRLIQHKTGKSSYTKHNAPYELVFHQIFETLKEARKAEFWIKKQKDRDFVERIIVETVTKSFR